MQVQLWLTTVGGGMRSETEKMTDKRKKEKEMKTERR